ncbi:MAG TPA: hypothetical protein PKM65_14810 [Spirochaetota bacterium]|nr:hypothetical protein [Spirochaetota bacterium]HNT10495.1 hypothetical protein [Spirochaetota bacterium]
MKRLLTIVLCGVMAIAMVTDGPAQKTKRGKGTQGRTKEAQKKRASETTSREKRAPLKAETSVRENTAAEELANKLSTIVLADPELGYRAAVHLRRRGGSAELIKQSAWTRERRTSLAELFELTSGSLAIEQSLQLMAGRDLSREEYRRDKTVSVGTLPAPQLKPHDFKALLGGKTVSVPESASMIPHDAIAVRCASIKHAIRLSDLAKLFKQQAPFFVANVGHGDDFEKKLLAQFGLKTPGPLVRKFYGVAIDEMSVMVEDPYLVEGADMAVLFKLGNKFLFKERIGKYRESFKKQVSGAAEGSISYNGFTIHTLTSPNGELRAHTVEHGDYWIIASSAWMARRIIDTIQGKVRSISDNLDYRYLLSVHRGAGDAFVYIGDDFVSKIISARFKIGELRRVNCEANLRMIGFARNLYAIERRAAPVFADLSGAKFYLPELVCPEGGTYDMRDGVPRCSKHGSLGGLLPLSANPVEMVTEGEAQRYRQFVDNYHNYWRKYVDPIGIRVDFGKNISVRTVILPLVENSEYRLLQTIMGGAPVQLEAVSIAGKKVVFHAACKLRFFDGYRKDLSHVDDERVRAGMLRFRQEFGKKNPGLDVDPLEAFGNELDFFFIERDIPEQLRRDVLRFNMRDFERILFRHVVVRMKLANPDVAKIVLPVILAELQRRGPQDRRLAWTYDSTLKGDTISFDTFGYRLIVLLRKDGVWITGGSLRRDSDGKGESITTVLERFMAEKDAFFSSTLRGQFDIPRNRTGNFEVGFHPANLDALRYFLNLATHGVYANNCMGTTQLVSAAVQLHSIVDGVSADTVMGDLGRYLPGRMIACPLKGSYSVAKSGNPRSAVGCSIHRTNIVDDSDELYRLFSTETEMMKVFQSVRFILMTLGFTPEGIDTNILIRDPLD